MSLVRSRAQGVRTAALVAAIALAVAAVVWSIGSKKDKCPVHLGHRASNASGQNASRLQTRPAVATIGKARSVVVMLLTMSAGTLVWSAAAFSPLIGFPRLRQVERLQRAPRPAALTV